MKDIDIDDNIIIDDIDNSDDLYVVSHKEWNLPGTLKLVKEFEGLRLTAY